MEFEGNRLELLEISKKVMKLADDNSPIEALKGIYLESDEDTGEVSMIATNFQASIFTKEKASVSKSGKIVINARILNGMLSLLGGERVRVLADNPRSVKVSSEKCVYDILYLSGEHYPKPVMPFPDEAVKMSGICSIAKKTVFATSKDSSKPILQCVNLKVKQNSAHAAATDGTRMMLVKGEAEYPGNKEFFLPAQAFQSLASISNDDDIYDVGIVGNEAVFSKKNLLFSIKQLSGSFIDTNSIVKSIVPKYSAIVNAKQMLDLLGIASVGAGTMPVNVSFTNNAIRMKCDGDIGMSQAEIQAKLTLNTPEDGFFYKPDYLHKLLQVLEGTIKIDIDDKGMMLIRSKNEIYFQLPVRPPSKKKEENTKAA